MARAKTPTPSVEEVVHAALKTLALGPRRLTGKGDPPPLLGNRAVDKLALSRLTTETRPLVKVEAGKRVSLTAAGFELVASDIPDEQIGPAAKAVAAALPASEQVDFLTAIIERSPLAAPDLVPLLETAAVEERTARDARLADAARRRDREQQALAALDRCKVILGEGRAARIESLKKELEIEGDAGQTTRAAAPRPDSTRPQSAEEFDFRRQVGRRLISSWQEACRMGKDEARQFLETAIANMTAIRQIGEDGERVPFDGAHHKADRAIREGDPVTIVRPGWVLDDERGEYLLAPAQVK